MASNVFPMLSSSPPPLDDCPDEDEEDEDFGNFASANIPFDSSFDSPVGGSKVKCSESSDAVNNAEFSKDIHSYSFSSTSPLKLIDNFDDKKNCDSISIPIKSKLSESSLNDDSPVHIIEEKPSHFVPDEKNMKIKLPNDSFEMSSCNSTEKCFVACEQNVSDEEKCEFRDFNGCEQVSFSEPLEFQVECKWDKDPSENTGVEIESNCNFPTFDSDAVKCPEFSENNVNLDHIVTNEENSAKFTCHFNADYSESDKLDECNSFEQKFDTSLNFSSSIDCGDFNSSCEQEVNQPVVFSCNFNSIQDKENFCKQSDEEFDDFQCSGDRQNVSFTDDSVDSKYTSTDHQLSECSRKECYSESLKLPDSSETKADKEDFADFQNFSDCALNSDEFADFEAAPFENNKTMESSDSCDFADFEVAPNTSSSFHLKSDDVPSTLQKNSDPLCTIVNTIFPYPEDESELDTFEPIQSVLEQSNKSRRLWEKLHEVEQTPSLRFQWGVSHSFQQLLRSINVDYHSILRMSSVPIFASGLSLLEPVKGLSNSTNFESEEKAQFTKDPIPPVEFDWNSSGLVNPLDAGQALSTLMDLSFLSSVGSNNTASTDDYSFENELLKPSPTFLCSDGHCKTQILDQLLSKNVSSLPNSKSSHRPSDLSEEAIHVLDQLPDLSFMQATVLMFPISSKN